MRISKAPEERKQEIIDTAMRQFSKNGYEETTISTIAKEMNVVSGLCYRYFKSTEEIYYTALDQYADACAAPFINIMNMDLDSFDAYCNLLTELFSNSDDKEKYHGFFHHNENAIFHKQLEIAMIEKIQPHMIALIQKLNDNHIIHVDHCRETALILLYGEMPIINDDTLRTEEKLTII